MVTCKGISEYLAHLDNIGLEDLRMAVIAANNDVMELQKNPRKSTELLFDKENIYMGLRQNIYN